MCVIKGCDAKTYCRGYCVRHYTYFYKHGTPYYEPKCRRLGQTKDPLYTTYAGMIARCYEKSNSCYKKYGAKGIKVCDRWRGPDGFINFKNDMGDKPEKHTLDRVNVFGNYSPDNCRWSSIALQAINKKKKSKIFRGVYKHSKCGYTASITVDGVAYRKHFMLVSDAIRYRKMMEEELLGGQLL